MTLILSLAFDFWWYHSLVAILCNIFNRRFYTYSYFSWTHLVHLKNIGFTFSVALVSLLRLFYATTYVSPFLYLLTFLMSFTSLFLKLTDLSLAFDFWWYHSLVAILCDWINLRSCNVLLSCGHAPQRWLVKLFVLPTVLFRDFSLRFCTLKYWLSPWLLPPWWILIFFTLLV